MVDEIQLAYDVSKLSSLDTRRERARKARMYCQNYISKHGAGQQMKSYACGIWCKVNHKRFCIVNKLVHIYELKLEDFQNIYGYPLCFIISAGVDLLTRKHSMNEKKKN